MSNVSNTRSEPTGRLRVSMPVAFGREYILPLLPAFTARYPAVEIDFQLDNRQVDLVGEGFDAAIGGSLELGAGIVSRELSRAHLIVAASPAYLAAHGTPKTPADLTGHDGVALRSALTGRLRNWTFRNAAGEEVVMNLRPRVIFDDMEAVSVGASLGLGIGLVAVALAKRALDRGELLRILPKWHADAGSLSIYYATHKLLPAKTRVFVDHVVEQFRKQRFAKRLRAD